MRESFKSRMEAKKKKKQQRVVKMSVKAKVISKGTSYSDKDDVRRKQRASNKKSITHAALNKLG